MTEGQNPIDDATGNPPEDGITNDDSNKWAGRIGTFVDVAIALFPYMAIGILAIFLAYATYVLPKKVANAVIQAKETKPEGTGDTPPKPSAAPTATQRPTDALKSTSKSNRTPAEANPPSKFEGKLRDLDTALKEINEHLKKLQGNFPIHADDLRITAVEKRMEEMLRLMGAAPDPESNVLKLIFKNDKPLTTLTASIRMIIEELLQLKHDISQVKEQLDPKSGSVYDQFQTIVSNKFDARLVSIDESLKKLLRLEEALREHQERVESAEEQVAVVLYNTASLPLVQYDLAIRNLQKESSYFLLLKKYRLGIFTATNAKVENTIKDFVTPKENWPQVNDPIGTEDPAGFCEQTKATAFFPPADRPWRRYVFVVSGFCQPPKRAESWSEIAAVDVVMIQTVGSLDTGTIEGWDRFCRANNGEFVLLRKLDRNATPPPKTSPDAIAAAPGAPSPAKASKPNSASLGEDMIAALTLRLERLIAPRLHLGPIKKL